MTYINPFNYITDYIRCIEFYNCKLLELNNKMVDYDFKDVNNDVYNLRDIMKETDKLLDMMTLTITKSKKIFANIVGYDDWNDEVKEKLKYYNEKIKFVEQTKNTVLYLDRNYRNILTADALNNLSLDGRICISNCGNILTHEAVKEMFNMKNDESLNEEYIIITPLKYITGLWETYYISKDDPFSFNTFVRFLQYIKRFDVCYDDEYDYHLTDDRFLITYSFTFNIKEYIFTLVPILYINKINNVLIRHLWNSVVDGIYIYLRGESSLWYYPYFHDEDKAEVEINLIDCEDLYYNVYVENDFNVLAFGFTNSIMDKYSRLMTNILGGVQMIIINSIFKENITLSSYMFKNITANDEETNNYVETITFKHPLSNIKFNNNFSFFINAYYIRNFNTKFINLNIPSFLTLESYDDYKNNYYLNNNMKLLKDNDIMNNFISENCTYNNLINIGGEKLQLTKIFNFSEKSINNIITNYITLLKDTKIFEISNDTENNTFMSGLERISKGFEIENLINGNNYNIHRIIINSCYISDYKKNKIIKYYFNNFNKCDELQLYNSTLDGLYLINERITNNMNIKSIKLNNTTLNNTRLTNIFKYSTDKTVSIYDLQTKITTRQITDLFDDNTNVETLELINCVFNNIDITKIINKYIKTINFHNTKFIDCFFGNLKVDYEKEIIYCQ